MRLNQYFFAAVPQKEVLKYHKTKVQDIPKDKNALNPTIKGIFLFVINLVILFYGTIQ
jgi:hypothetical protein